MKTAVVLFNLGGPDSLDAVEPFLFNLFFDPAIIRLPKPQRFLVAKLISSRRAPKTKEIYKFIGNKSLLLELTEAQGNALKQSLNQQENGEFEVFVAMRYWHPRAKEVVEKIKKFSPQKIILLPLYPQFSTTTSQSSIQEFQVELKRQQLNCDVVTIGCYPYEQALIDAHVELLLETQQKIPAQQPYRILFSAHGLPKKNRRCWRSLPMAGRANGQTCGRKTPAKKARNPSGLCDLLSKPGRPIGMDWALYRN